MRLLYLTNIKTPPLAKSRQPWHEPFQDTSNTNHEKPPGQTFHMSTDLREGLETPTEWKSESVTFLRTWIGPRDAYSSKKRDSLDLGFSATRLKIVVN